MNSVNGRLAPTEQAAGGHRHLFCLVFVLSILLPAHVWAQADEAAEPDPLFSGIATFLVAAISLIVIAWQRRQARRENMRADHFAERSSLLEAALNSAPWPYFGWTESGSPLVDPAFAAALGKSEIASIDDLLSALNKQDADILDAALRTLRTDGTSFDLTLHRLDRDPIRLIGRRGQGLHAGSDGKTGQADLVWLVDPKGRGEHIDA